MYHAWGVTGVNYVIRYVFEYSLRRSRYVCIFTFIVSVVEDKDANILTCLAIFFIPLYMYVGEFDSKMWPDIIEWFVVLTSQ